MQPFTDSPYENELQHIPPGPARTQAKRLIMLKKERLEAWKRGDSDRYEELTMQIITNHGKEHL